MEYEVMEIDVAKNLNGCVDCRFFLITTLKEVVCVHPKQPKGSDGYIHLISGTWERPNSCKLHKLVRGQ